MQSPPKATARSLTFGFMGCLGCGWGRRNPSGLKGVEFWRVGDGNSDGQESVERAWGADHTGEGASPAGTPVPGASPHNSWTT